ncbi:MAG: glycerophosphodiester phosphodiesterase [Oscillospiraceae bacterium]|nr:glycerophosphodiester phosphodiesterase [Oscillospiraceae bacterium]
MKKWQKILAVAAVVIAVLYIFLIAPGNSKDLSPFQGVAFAHRGYFDNENDIPENSLAAFSAAIDKGFGIELDVALSKDGVAMVFHDADLARVCGVEGKIWEYTCRELQQMQLLGTGHTVPTLQQAMELISGRVPVIVEYKMDLIDTAVCEKGHRILKDYQGDYCIKSFDPRVLMWYKANAPQVIRGQLAEEFWKSEKYAGKPLYLALSYLVENVATRPDFISYKFTDRDNISLKLCRLLGAETACWTLRSSEDYAAVAGKFDMYIFDSFDISECME